jgi:hypothetical protein
MRNFDLSDVLSVTTGALVSTRHVNGVYDIVGYVAGDRGVTTIGLVMLHERVAAAILDQHPELNNVTFPYDMISEEMDTHDRQAAIDNWLAEQRRRFAESLPVAPMGEPLVLSLEDQVGYIRAINPTAQVIVVGALDKETG